MKRWWKWATPYAQLAVGILPPIFVGIYLCITFFGEVKDALAAVPIMQQQIAASQQQITANKAQQDQGFAVINVKLDMTMDYLGVPKRGRNNAN